jgi:hypothetical protein
MPTANAQKKLAEMLRDVSVSPQDRGDMFTYATRDEAFEHREILQGIIAEADLGRALQERMEAVTRHSLASERFLGSYHVSPNSPYAIVTNGPQVMYLPTTSEEIANFRRGDSILIDMESRQIVGRDGAAPISGEIVSIESRPPEHPGHAVIQQRDQLELVRLTSDMIDRTDSCQPGDQVLYDSVRKFVLGPVTTRSNGDELLTNPQSLAAVRREDIGSLHPVVDEIRDRYLAAIEHPHWCRALQVRTRCSYLWVGGSGTGKSFHLKLLANEIHDIVESLTGIRSSRLVMLDASDFWAPYFGETEQRIARWAAKLEQLGSRALTTRDGRLVHFPLLICLEEGESLLRGRGESDGSGHLFDRALSLFLQKTDSLENALQVPLMWITTSNRPDLADSAGLRRMGMRRVVFDMLSPAGIRSVLLKKIPADMPLGAHGQPSEAARMACVHQLLGYLVGPQPKQEVAEVVLQDGRRQPVLRQDMISPALLEETVSAGVDAALRKSRQQGRLVGLDANDMIHFLHRHFADLVPTLRAHNIAEYCPRLFRKQSPLVRDVQPLLEPAQRSFSLLLDQLFTEGGIAS